MGYLKLYYILLDLKKVVISIYFNQTITSNLSSLIISFYILSMRFFGLKFSTFLTCSHIFCLFTLKSFFFFKSSTRFIVVNLRNLNIKQH
jgi:hypothetical protein